MGAGHGIHVVEFAAGGGLTLKRTSVPGSASELMPVVTIGSWGSRLANVCLWIYLGGIRLG
jgi:hypothetical protein